MHRQGAARQSKRASASATVLGLVSRLSAARACATAQCHVPLVGPEPDRHACSPPRPSALPRCCSALAWPWRHILSVYEPTGRSSLGRSGTAFAWAERRVTPPRSVRRPQCGGAAGTTSPHVRSRVQYHACLLVLVALHLRKAQRWCHWARHSQALHAAPVRWARGCLCRSRSVRCACWGANTARCGRVLQQCHRSFGRFNPKFRQQGSRFPPPCNLKVGFRDRLN